MQCPVAAGLSPHDSSGQNKPCSFVYQVVVGRRARPVHGPGSNDRGTTFGTAFVCSPLDLPEEIPDPHRTSTSLAVLEDPGAVR